MSSNVREEGGNRQTMDGSQAANHKEEHTDGMNDSNVNHVPVTVKDVLARAMLSEVEVQR